MDKKISQQTEHITPILGIDLLPMVGNTVTTPVNYKVQVKNFLSQIEIDLPQTTFSALKITASVTANANAASLAAGEFAMIANSSVGAVVRDRYGLLASNKIQNGNSSVVGQMAAAMFTLDTGNSATVAGNTFGVIINHALDANVATARLVAPRAYLAVQEDAGTNALAKTTYLMDIGASGKLVSQDLANTNASVIFSATADAPATHMLKVSVGGMDFWLLGSNTGPA
jgi:hypothetical protein